MFVSFVMSRGLLYGTNCVCAANRTARFSLQDGGIITPGVHCHNRGVATLPWGGLQYQGNAAPQALEAAQCLDDVRAAHAAYLHAVRRLRLSEPERDWHVVASAITAVLNAVLQFCALVRASRRDHEVHTSVLSYSNFA